MTLCLDKRGELINQEYVSGNRVELHFRMPLGEIVIDFYDKLKSISKGYASFDYHLDGFRPSKLANLSMRSRPWRSKTMPWCWAAACVRSSKTSYRVSSLTSPSRLP